MSKLYQIKEGDLAELEDSLPKVVELLYDRMDNALRARVRRIQGIITDVRWNYGPPTDVEVLPAGDEP